MSGKENTFLFTSDPHDEKGPPNANTTYRRTLKATYEEPEFVVVLSMIGGLLGIHSIRKFAASFGHAMGLHIPSIDCRGRWKLQSGNGGRKGGSIVEK